MSHRIPPEAGAEFAEAVRCYSEINPELGTRFYREMERVIVNGDEPGLSKAGNCGTQHHRRHAK